MRILIGVLILASGYIIGAAVGYALVLASTSNTHDASVEAAMTGAFVAGPIVAVVAVSIWLLASRKPSVRER
jgi:hypothetical protein